MDILLPAISECGPCVAALGLGWFLRQSVCSEADGEAAAKFALWITLPSVILQTFNRVPLTELQLPIVLVCTLTLTISALIAWFRAKDLHPRERGLISGVSIGANVSLVAIPFAAALFPGIGLRAALLCAGINLLVTHFVSYLLFATAGAAFPENFEHLDGGNYRGEWKGMLKEGYGVYTYPSGARYEGQWREGVKEGRGVYFFPKGGLYEGEWRGGTMTGIGVRTFASGKVQSGLWEAGKIVNSMEELQCALAVEGANEAAAVAKQVVVGGATVPAALYNLGKQPAAWAFLLAGVMSGVGLPLSPSIDVVTRTFAAVHGPLALLAAGLLFNFEDSIPQKQMKEVAIHLATRLLPPLIILLAATVAAHFLGWPVSPVLLHVLGPLAVCAVAPVPQTALQYAHIFRLNESLAAGLIQAGTIVSFILMPFLGVVAAVSAAAGSVLPLVTALASVAAAVAMTTLLIALKRPAVKDTRVKMVYKGPSVVTTEAVSASSSSVAEKKEVPSTTIEKQPQQDGSSSNSSGGDDSAPPSRSSFKDVDGGNEGGGPSPPFPAAAAAVVVTVKVGMSGIGRRRGLLPPRRLGGLALRKGFSMPVGKNSVNAPVLFLR